jgi:hypothetical protein
MRLIGDVTHAYGCGNRAYPLAMDEIRECAQCGTVFAPRREHARFCSPRCRMSWNHEHAGVAAAPAVAIEWSVVAMAEAADLFAVLAMTWDQRRAATAVGETVWWVTLIDATFVRYHSVAYEKALASKAVRRRKTEEALEGLRYVRNQLGRGATAESLIAPGEDKAGWIWQPLPEPDLAELGPTAREWELSRYCAYQSRLAGREVARTFTRCSEFLTYAASLSSDPVRRSRASA